MLRYSADRLPVFLIFALTALDFIMYFTVESPWLLMSWFVLMIIPKGCICSWNHHHQHTRTFLWTPLNRLLELSYALHTGVTTNLWLLHHVFGHHHNYLDQTKDESRWQRTDGTQMGEWEYTWKVAATAYYRGFLVGRRYPGHLRTHLIYTAVTLLLVALLVAFKPLQGLILFVVPMVVGLLITAWATYDHHAGLPTDDDFGASYNNMNPLFNLLTGNLGYHTAHHFRQGTHWSRLPQLHAEISDRIPTATYRRSVWDAVTDLPLLRLAFRP